MTVKFSAIPTETVAAYRAGRRDAYGLPPETKRQEILVAIA